MRAMAEDDLPPCGVYRTSLALDDDVPAGRLVYFHNHGDPGPGVYLPTRWTANRAHWAEEGHTIPGPDWALTLVALPAEGLYRVVEPFTCCDEGCRTFEPDLLVQLGYDGDAHALLFVPEWTTVGLAIPELGFPIDDDRLGRLAPLTVEEAEEVEDASLH
jgi:hypothetical protein